MIKKESLGSNNPQLCAEGLGSCWELGTRRTGPCPARLHSWVAHARKCRICSSQGGNEAREPHQRAQPCPPATHCSPGG